jgi:cytochrome c-type biogenesis protein CcmH/NrfG
LPKAAVWVVLGEAYKAKGDRVKANAALRRAMEIAPRDLWLQRIVREGDAAILSAGDEFRNEPKAAEKVSSTEGPRV